MNANIRATIKSLKVQKFIQIQKNLSNPIPKLWDDGDIFNSKSLPWRSNPVLLELHTIDPTLQHLNQVHAQLVVSGNFQHPLLLGRLLKTLCSSKSTLPRATKIFGCIDEPDAFMCNSIMRGYVNFDEPGNALAFYYGRMVKDGIFENRYTFPVLMKACGDLCLVSEGEKVHAIVVKRGWELDLYVRNTMIHMYAVCGSVGDARKVFDMSPESDLVTWNTMIDAYVKNGDVGFARLVFDAMPERDVFSWNTMISGYVGIGELDAAMQLFDWMPSKDIVSWNCLIDGYSQIGDVIAARSLFDRMGRRNVVSWNCLMALYVRIKDCDECLRLFDRMMMEGDVKPNEATLMSVLTACAHLRRLDRGQWIHSFIKNTRWIKPDVLLMTAVITMYAKCGALDSAKCVFDAMPEKSGVVTWNSMIMGYGTHGMGKKALEMFLEMIKLGVMPNDATFVCVLSACAHAGMVMEGWWVFNLMLRVYRVEPRVDHFGCMVDLLQRSGLMDDIKKLPLMESGPSLWSALLSDCGTHLNTELGVIVARKLMELRPGDVGPYKLLCDIYAIEGRWEDVESVRKMMGEKDIHTRRKQQGLAFHLRTTMARGGLQGSARETALKPER
ncbi:unnamed protein product [Cuscuta campestris]|uniref:Pentacotripeptide-repeat region of PRORP domain-containing protein n=1 Tax=Cuscuta campestris TaxID=132261 RepID=A0A484KGZ7_9ASTE|nr:unnamed protein product [Cuscuta campestris]